MNIQQDWAEPVEAKASIEQDLNNFQIIVFCSILNMLLLWSTGLL